MPKFLFHGTFTSATVQDLMKEAGGANRVIAAKELVKSVGGKLEAFYFGLGDEDYYVIVDLPDSATAAALALSVAGRGTVLNKTTPLLTPEEVDSSVHNLL